MGTVGELTPTKLELWCSCGAVPPHTRGLVESYHTFKSWQFARVIPHIGEITAVLTILSRCIHVR